MVYCLYINYIMWSDQRQSMRISIIIQLFTEVKKKSHSTIACCPLPCCPGGGQQRSATPKRSRKTSSGWGTTWGSSLFTSSAPTTTCGPTRPGSSLTWTWMPTVRRRWGKALMPPTRKVCKRALQSGSVSLVEVVRKICHRTCDGPSSFRVVLRCWLSDLALQRWRRRLCGFASCRRRKNCGSFKKTGRTTRSLHHTNTLRSGRRGGLWLVLTFHNVQSIQLLKLKESFLRCQCQYLFITFQGQLDIIQIHSSQYHYNLSNQASLQHAN